MTASCYAMPGTDVQYGATPGCAPSPSACAPSPALGGVRLNLGGVRGAFCEAAPDLSWSPPLSAYTRATQCPVLT
eukprot:2444229-Rhodomonas_salina.3